jgi:formylglycine-generating enzyme required for sulfatase activity
MKRVLIALALWSAGCGDEFVVVRLVDAPLDPGTRVIVRGVLDGRALRESTWPISGSPQSPTLALRFGYDVRGRLSLGVEVWRDDCTLAYGVADTTVIDGRSDVDVTVTALPQEVCGGTFDRPPDMVLVPAGAFRMGCAPGDGDCLPSESPNHQVTLSAFFIDRTEVSEAAYADCVSRGGCKPAFKSPTSAQNAQAGMSWEMADAYCRFRGKRLPTEAEWEKAARGTDQRLYPWGDETPTCTRALFKNCREFGEVAPIASHPGNASPYGALDMAGNLAEWVADWFDSYPSAAATDPTGPDSGEYKVLRGGGWFDEVSHLRTSFRFIGLPNGRAIDDTISPELNTNDKGFRCARGGT